ncbi:tape measure protein [Streptomyces phage Nesbitt]|uniref:Tape measure protein n=1 Tax=Streptomyces phage Nesbitt TaxID=2108133 RepID=A0A2P1JT43_9CAUD|nr:tape measure protein [Streptomyces phage Nesbitt]
MPAPEIAVAYVSIVPSLQGFQGDLRRQVMGPTEDAGQEAGAGFGSKLKAGIVAGALAAGALGAKALTDAFAQASITKKVQAQLGATSKDAARYGKVAGRLYSQGVVDTFEEGAEAIRATVQGGLVPPDATNAQLESIATKMSDVATTFGTDMGMQTQAVSAMLKNGLAPDAESALDTIAYGFQKLGPNAEDLLETFQEYSIQLRKLGIDSNTALGLFQQGLKGGARDTDIVADALKEFSIRAVDMSTSSRDAYKALGLSAKDMETMIGKGGQSATKGLDIVLDKLRGIHDPVEREAAAVGLFGTQAEDLGKALFELDPSAAVSTLGKVGGTAKEMGKTLRNGPLYELQTFKRELEQGLVEAMGSYAIPALKDGIVALRDLTSWGKEAFTWARDASPWLLPLAIAIGGVTFALNAQKIAIALTTAVFGVYRGAMLVGTAVTNGLAGAQALLNAVMALNPFVLVAIAVAAFVAAVIVAYNKVGWFRDLVDVAFKAIGDVVMWLWNVAIKPTFALIGEIFMWLYTLIAVIVIAPVMVLMKALGALFGWLYKVAVKPSLDAIGALGKWLWEKVLKPVWGYLMEGLRTLGGVFKWLYDKGVKPPLESIAATGKWLWNKALKPTFDLMKDGVEAIADSFKDGKDLIEKQWAKLEDIAKAPVEFVIDYVYNKGIVPLWNKVAKVVGGKTLGEFKGFARGGILPGTSSFRDGDDQLVPMRKGEGVYVSEAMKDPYERARLHAVNQAAMRGQSLSKYQGGQGYAKGGIIGSLSGLMGDVWDWGKDTVGGFLKKGFGKVTGVLDNIPGANTGWGGLIKDVPLSWVKSLTSFGEEKEKNLTGGPGVKAALAWARTQAGKPYQWGGAGNPSWDCSGFMAGIQKKIMGQNPNGRLWATGAFRGDQAPAGWARNLQSPFMIGITNANKGHTAGTLAGVNVESRGGDGVVVGSSARSYKSGLFTDVYGFAPAKKYDNGGWLMPGARQTRNETGRPEPVFTASQWSSIHTLASRGASSGIADGARITLVTDGGSFEAYVDARADDRINKGLVEPANLGRNL